MKKLWPVTEAAVIVGMLVALVVWQRGGGPLVDEMMGWPPIDERLIVATAQHDQAEFDAALAGGADVRARDRSGSTALACAAGVGSAARAARLIAAGADVNGSDNAGYTPLMRAAAHDHADVVALLLRNGADPGQLSVYGRTALDEARSHGSSNAAAVLEAWGRGGRDSVRPSLPHVTPAAAPRASRRTANPSPAGR